MISKQADVCVVGAGIAGLSVAYQLARAGRSVIVLDSRSIGGGESGQTSAHLSSALDDRYANLEKIHGAEGARMAYLSHSAAIDAIEEISVREGNRMRLSSRRRLSVLGRRRRRQSSAG